jgi:hypothetical protein
MQDHYYKKKSLKNVWIGVSSFLISGLLIMVGVFALPKLFSNSNVTSNNSSSLEAIVSSSSKPPVPKNVSMNTLFFGDVFWGRYINDWSDASPLKTAYPFSGLSTFSRENYDAWIADLECPITPVIIDSATMDDTLTFNCLPGYTKEAAKWFTAFTLANNHTDNQEPGGIASTRSYLDAEKVQYFGHPDNAQKQDICEIVSLPAKLNFTEKPFENTKIAVAMCGFHNVFKLPTEEELAVISNYSAFFPTIVMPHQGKEYSYTHDDLQESYFHKMIDLGADAVIADHVHSVQETEVYKGKMITYSLGNFIFDQQRTEQVTRAFGLNANFSFVFDEVSTPKYLELSKTCLTFKDSCLEQFKNQKLTKPKFTIAYDVVCSDNSGKLAKLATTQVCDSIKEKIQWEKTKVHLKQ